MSSEKQIKELDDEFESDSRDTMTDGLNRKDDKRDENDQQLRKVDSGVMSIARGSASQGQATSS